MGRHELGFIRQAYLTGRPLPERIANAPDLKEGLALYLQAFFDLDSERNHGFGLAKIPWSKAWQYAEACGLNGEWAWYLTYLVSKLDEVNLGYLEKTRAKNNPPKSSKSPRG